MYFYFFSFFLLQLGLQNIPFPLATTNSLSVPFYICICKKKKKNNKTFYIIYLRNKKSFGTHVSVALIFTSEVAGGGRVCVCEHVHTHMHA